MLTEVHPGLWVGDLAHCRPPGSSGPWPTGRWGAMIHGCKAPCHQLAVGYGGAINRNLPPSHPEYLYAERGAHLVLNLIDPPIPLFKLESFTKSLDWLDKWSGSGAVLIHCNHGYSRAPSIALLWMAKRVQVLDGTSFPAARSEFVSLHYPDYAPGAGLTTFLTDRWDEVA